MFEPTTILLVASAAVSAVSYVSSARSASKTAKANAKIDDANAKAAENKAKYDETMHRARVRKILSSQRSNIGRSGVTMEGSPLLSLKETAKEGEMDALAIRYGGSVSGSRYRSQAELSRMKGKSAKTAGYMQAGSTLLTAGAKYYGSQTTPKEQ